MANMYEDMQEELSYMKQAFDHIYAKDAPLAAEAMTEHTTFNFEWFPENLPLENAEGTALDEYVRETLAAACYKEKAPEMPKVDPPKPQDILVFSDQAGFCTKLLNAAPEGRVGTKKIVTKPPSLLTAEDVESVLGSKPWDLVIFGCALDPPASSSVPDVIARQHEVAKFALEMIKTILKKDGCIKKLAVLTNDIFTDEEETHKKRGLAGICHSWLFGWCNTARLESEGFPVQLIDTELVDDRIMIPHVVSELFRSQTFGVATVRLTYPSEIKNGIRTNRPAGRYVLKHVHSREYEKVSKEFELPERGIIGIAGGNGALGLVMGEWIIGTAEKYKSKSGGAYDPKFEIQFLSRSMKVGDMNMARWKSIQARAEALGVKVAQTKMDVSSQANVDEYFKSVTPNLIGLIHSAGVLQDSMIFNMTWQKFETCWEGKHQAGFFMHDALERFINPNLKFFWVFSSTSVFGNMGQLNYSASNSQLDALARYRQSQGKPMQAMMWGAWGDVGMAASMDDVMRRRVLMGPMPYFSIAQGLAGMEGGLRTGLPWFSTYLMNPPVFFGMIQGDASTTACHMRNWSEPLAPTPAPNSFTSKDAYNIYRMCRYVLAPYDIKEGLYYNKFVKPCLKEEEEEDLLMLKNGPVFI